MPTLPGKDILPKIVDQFASVHAKILHTIEQWSKQPQAMTHPFYLQWVEAKYHNLTSTSSWEKVQRTLKCSHYGEYMDIIQQCPLVPQTYHMEWIPDDNSLNCHMHRAPSPPEFSTIMGMATSYYNQMQTMAHKFEGQVHMIKHRMDELQTTFTYWDQYVEARTKRACDQIQDTSNNHLWSIQDTAQQTLDRFSADVQTLITDKTAAFMTTLVPTNAMSPWSTTVPPPHWRQSSH